MGLYVVEPPLRYPAALLRGSSLLNNSISLKDKREVAYLFICFDKWSSLSSIYPNLPYTDWVTVFFFPVRSSSTIHFLYLFDFKFKAKLGFSNYFGGINLLIQLILLLHLVSRQLF